MDSKKGFAMVQMLLIGVFLLVFALVAIFSYKAFDDLNTELQLDPDISVAAKNVSSNLHSATPDTLDNAFLTIFGLLFIVSMVAAYFIDDNPLWLIVVVFVLIMTALVAGAVSNTWDEFTDDDAITFEHQYPKTNWILDHFLIVMLAVSASIGLVIFAKGRG